MHSVKRREPCLLSSARMLKTGSLSRGPPCLESPGVTVILDFLQVDLLVSGASLFWPRAREVDLSRLMGFHSHFAPKMGGAVTCIWVSGFICESLTSMAECADSTPT